MLRQRVSTMALDATGIAEKVGNPKSANVVLLGALVKAMGLTDIDWDPIIAKTVKPVFIDVNRKAFAAGMAAVG